MHTNRKILAFALVVAGFIAAVVLLETSPPSPSPHLPSGSESWRQRSLFELAPLSGIVVDERGEAIAEASIEAYSLLGRRVQLIAEQTTDAEGSFNFAEVPEGFVALVATAAGRSRRVQIVDLHRGGLSEVEIVLDVGASIAGQVVNEAEAPVASVRVCARSHDVGPVPELEAQCSSTDDEGVFSIGNVSEGLLAVAVDGEGIASMVRPDVIAPVDALVLRVTRRGALRGTVRLPNGRAADDAEVLIAGSGLWPPRVITVTGDGTYLVEDLPAGVYELEARSEGLVSMRELGVEIIAGRPVTVDLDLEQGAALQGRVLDGRSGEPIEEARIVVANDLLSTAPTISWSGSDGHFVVTGLAPGEHRLSVWSDGRVPVVGRPCIVPSEVEVTLAPEAVVSGRVVDERGYPIEGASVEPDLANPQSPLLVSAPPAAMSPVSSTPFPIEGSGGELGVYPGLEEIDFDLLPLEERAEADGSRSPPSAADRSAVDLTHISTATSSLPASAVNVIASRTKGSWPVTTDRGGEFRLGGLPAGSVVVLASHRAMAPGRSKALTLSPGDHIEDVVIVLSRGVELRGRVVDSRGFPVEGVLLSLIGEGTSRQGRLTFSERDGTFLYDGVAGQVTLSASHSSYAPATIVIDIPVEAEAQEVEFALEEAARTVQGRVLDSRDHPISGADVSVRSVTSGSPLVRHAISAEDGTFSVDGMAGGLVVVQARAAGMSTGSTSAGPDVDEVTIWLESAGALLVEVIDPHTGDAIEGCSVDILASIGRRGRHACEAGSASLVGLPTGQATLWISAPGRATQEVTAHVEPGVDVSDPDAYLRVELPASTVIRGQVLDAEGEAVVGARVSLLPLPRTFTPSTRGDWVESGVQGSFEIEGLELDAAAVIHADHPSLGAAQVEVEPAWEGDEPEVEIWLEAPERARGRGRHFGVAADMAARGGGIVVAQVAAGSRAESSGLRRGDQVHLINGVEVVTVIEAYRRLRGPRNTALVMTIRRGDDEVVFLIERELVLR